VSSSFLFAKEARHLGKSDRTRALLMDAATRLFASQGFEGTSVSDIARQAEVANGTFYSHFPDRDAIAAAVAYGIAQRIIRLLDEAMVEVEDAVDRVSFGCRHFIELASRNPDWGGALFHAAWAFPDLRTELLDYPKADLERGVSQGVFGVTVDEPLLSVFAGMVMSGLFTRIRDPRARDIGQTTAEMQLRMLGVPIDRAREAAWRPLEPLQIKIVQD
jgi:AcrR family transcriptional regulator